MVMCYDPSLSLGATDTITYYISLVSVYDGVADDVAAAANAAEAFVPNTPPTTCCVGRRGNFNCSPDDAQIDISDLVDLVCCMFGCGFQDCEFCCIEEANIDGDQGEIIDISDLVYLVDFMFTGGPPPSLCP